MKKGGSIGWVFFGEGNERWREIDWEKWERDGDREIDKSFEYELFV